LRHRHPPCSQAASDITIGPGVIIVDRTSINRSRLHSPYRCWCRDHHSATRMGGDTREICLREPYDGLRQGLDDPLRFVAKSLSHQT
jgi:hypothetical protein